MRKNRISFVCQYCGKTFDVPLSETYRRKAGVKFCSMTCYQASRWGYTGKCHNCGKPSNTKFCTPKCQKDYWNKNGYDLQKKRRNWERKLEIIKSLGGKCVRCGIADIRVLDIHHISQETKKTPKKRVYNWTRRFIDWNNNSGNLEILCANCHRIHTWEQMNYGQTDEVASELLQSSS